MNPSQGGGIQRKQALIAQLLRHQNSEDGDDASSCASGRAATGDLSGLLGRIDTFFAGAGSAPAPRSIEVRESKTKSAKGQSTDDGHESEEEQEIHLNLLLGVLQAKEAKPDNKAGFSKDGLLLPGKQAEKLLEAEKMRDSKTLLSMMSALGNTTGENTSAEDAGSDEDGDAENDDGASEGCMIFDAEDMSSSDSDDGDRLGIITRQPATTKGKRLIEEM